LIIVHHLTPIATRSEQHDVDPVAALRPVCADCHLVIHRRTPPFTIEEVRTMMEEAARSENDIPSDQKIADEDG
jgi:predicted HNH restriction endonuclease